MAELQNHHVSQVPSRTRQHLRTNISKTLGTRELGLLLKGERKGAV